ncbi:MAG: DNA polymerase IV [Candidatus Omnitrophica bacterium]|nr:DNA polymerase IV [Candidatus Omnitrophota bacterium]
MRERYIIHIDMDAFFASIEQRDRPLLRGKPVIIGADPKSGKGRGVVSTCSYEARKFGIHSAMPISIAYKKCPNGVYLRPDMEKYSAVSRTVHKTLYDFTPHVEPLGFDEAFLDISGSWHLFGSPFKTCLLLKSKIKKMTGLTSSIGLAPTKMAAKIASDLKKPDGLIEVKKENLLDFLWPLEVDKIWGLGKKSKAIFNKYGIKTIGDIAKKDVNDLVRLFGKNGFYFWQIANGIDESQVQADEKVKSISNEYTFEEDTIDKDEIESMLMFLSERVSHRMRFQRLAGRTITLKIRLQGFFTYTRAFTLTEYTNSTKIIYSTAKELYYKFDRKRKKVRLIGVKVSNLSPTSQIRSLFDKEGNQGLKEEDLNKAIDKIKLIYGVDSIHRARGM